MTKRIIINKNQLGKIYEAEGQLPTIDIQANDNTPSGFANALQTNKSQITAAQAAAGSDVDVMISGPKKNETLPAFVQTVNSGEDAASKIQQMNSSAIGNGASVKLTGSGIGGSSVNESYTKAEVENMKRQKFLENHYILTKKQIKESIGGDGEEPDFF